MPVLETQKIVDEIKQITIPVIDYRDDFLGFYQCMKKNIDEHQDFIQEKLGYIDLIVVEDLYQDYKRSPLTDVVIQTKERDIFNIFVFGDFEKDNQIIWELSEVFSEFVAEFVILPIFTSFPKNLLVMNSGRIIEQVKGGIIIYES
ncbi:hypothetical protein [Spirulina sp. 06S082]|uniref:hypothetical protein n=1 Tax=Spirulina sp. 06S082 TaxID=3110248 RepID=UPI002B1FF8DD|nr:hypothetical protein [Spirulina sp. 06S082]MEA5467566.1 hypothetical protein [Spirulina sp. 06S082]